MAPMISTKPTQDLFLLALVFTSVQAQPVGQDPGHPLFEFGPRVGLVLISEAAITSAAAVIFMLGWKGFVAIQDYRNPLPGPEARPSHLHLEIYFANLMVADLIQAIGSILHINWVVKGYVTSGLACTTQAVFKQLGDVGVALSTLAITVHTFVVLHCERIPPSSPLLPLVVISLVWITAVLMIGISFATHHGYYGPTGYWCWIVIRYKAGQIATEYAWMWFTVVVNLVLYIPLFFRLRSQKNTGVYAARRLLWCPVAYTVIILPMSVSRFLAFYGHTVPYQSTVFGAFLLALSGVINVTLYTITRPRLHPVQARHRRRSSAATLLTLRTQSPPAPGAVNLATDGHDHESSGTPSWKDSTLASV